MVRTSLIKVASMVILAAGTAGIALPATAGAAAPQTPTCRSAPATAQCVVSRGDSLWAIARRNHTTVARLVQLNQGKYPSLRSRPGRIYSGWVLTLR
jgi:LysM repeat protein